jgi:hypothetical protein
MRNILTAAIVTGTLLTLPAMGLASPVPTGAPANGTPSSSSPATQAPMHATKGVVAFVNATKLVVERSPRYGGNMTFVLNPSTERDGNIKVGSTVEVRYRTEAHQRIATVVTAEHAKAAASAPASQR